MTIKSSGSISISDINSELGLSRTTPKNLGNTEVRSLLQRTSGAVSLSNAYGKSKGNPHVSLTSQYLPGGGTGYRDPNWPGNGTSNGGGSVSSYPLKYDNNAIVYSFECVRTEIDGWDEFAVVTSVNIGSTLYFTLNGVRYGIPLFANDWFGSIYVSYGGYPILYAGVGYDLVFG